MIVRWKSVLAVGAMASSVLAQQPGRLLDVMRVQTEGDASAALVMPKKGPVRTCRVRW